MERSCAFARRIDINSSAASASYHVPGDLACPYNNNNIVLGRLISAVLQVVVNAVQVHLTRGQVTIHEREGQGGGLGTPRLQVGVIRAQSNV
jgi:hypothetical protein